MTTVKPKVFFIKDAELITGRNRLTLRRWWERNFFPKPTLINSRLAWRAEDIEQWINQHVQGVRHEKNSSKQSV
jgi:prophage regulatory protein